MPQIKLSYMMGLKLRMFPNHRQQRIFWKNINAARFVYNQLLANSRTDALIAKINRQSLIPETCWQTKHGHSVKGSQVRPTGLDRIKQADYPWLADTELDSDMFTNVQVNYRDAWKMYRKVHTHGIPRFKRKDAPVQGYSTSNHYASVRVKEHGGVPSLYNGSIHFVDNRHLKLPKVGVVKIKLHRALPSNQLVRIATTTVKHEADGCWYVSLLLKSDRPFVQSAKPTGKAVGFDLNTENFLTTSDGETIANPRYYRKMQAKLANEQRKLSRKARRAKREHRSLKQAKNYQRQKLVVAQLMVKVRHQRENFLHNLSTSLVKNHDLVVGEELRSKNMLKNHALAKSIQDVGWRTFLAMLEYKATLYNKQFVTVNPAYTTQTCADCGFRMGTQDTKKLTLADREWTCPQCGNHHIRDYNAAVNILHKGQLALANQ